MGALMLFFQGILPDWIGTLLGGAVMTIKLSLVGLAIGFAVGLPIGLARTYGPGWLQRLASGYITLFRGTPLLIQLFIVYYGLPDVDIVLSRFSAAVITLGLNSAAYQAEYFRGALQAVGGGQMIAARAIGMNQIQAIRYIILPQAARIALPAWSNEMISMIKYTAVVFIIAVPELMGRAKFVSSRNFDPIATYLAVAVIYLAMIGVMSLFLRFVEKRIEIPGMHLEAERH